jgi:hypothetical protein
MLVKNCRNQIWHFENDEIQCKIDLLVVVVVEVVVVGALNEFKIVTIYQYFITFIETHLWLLWSELEKYKKIILN